MTAHRAPSGDVTRGLRLGVAALVAMLAVALAAVLALGGRHGRSRRARGGLTSPPE